MLYTWLLIAAVAAGAVYAEDADDCCSVEDKKEVAFMWHKIWHTSYTDRKVRIMKAVVDHLLETHPPAKQFLTNLHIEDETSPAFRAYVVRVAQGFDTVINLLDSPAVLHEQLDFLAEKFGTKVNLKQSYFEVIAESFEHVLPQVASCFNVQAWSRCLRRLAHAVSAKVPTA
jgi:hypothetical protein